MDGTPRDHPIDRVLLPVFLAYGIPQATFAIPTHHSVTVETVMHSQCTEPHHLYMGRILNPWRDTVKSYFCKLQP